MASSDDLELKLEVKFQFYPPTKKGAKATAWFKTKGHLEAVVDALADLAMFADLKLGGADDKLKPFKTAAAAKPLVAIGRDEDTQLQSDDEAFPALKVLFQPFGDDEFNLKMWCRGAALTKHRDTIIEQYITATQRVREALDGSAGIFKGFVVPSYRSTGRFEYSRPRPPRRHPGVPIHSVVDFIDLRFHGSKHPEAEPKEARALTSSAPPSPARRSEKDELVVLQWAKNASVAELQRAASEREVWFAEQVDTELEHGFNEQGDELEDRGKTEQKAPLTLYSAKHRVGYKAVVVFPDGSIEPHAWNQAKMVLAKKASDDGSPVDAVKVVVPLRDLAFTIADEAKKAGFAGVLYPSGDGKFWDPNPPGMWRTPAVGAESAKPFKPRAKKSGRSAKSRD